MRKGDLAFFYHSNIGKEIVGVVEVVREAYPDPTAEKGDWVAWTCRRSGRCRTRSRWPRSRLTPTLADFALVRQSRLSVMPVSTAHWERLCRMGGWPG